MSINRPVRSNFLLPAAILAIGVVLSLLLFFAFRTNIEHQAKLRFERNASDAQHVIEARIDAYTDALRGLKALFAAQDIVSRMQFHDYVASLDLKRRYPGFESLNYAAHVATHNKPDFEQAVRRDTSLEPGGYPDFAIKPAGQQAEYFPLIYLEPMIKQVFGRDLASISPANAASLFISRDSGELRTSGRLIRMEGPRPFTGLAMRLPVYRRGLPLLTVAQRRAAYTGSVGAGYNVKTLMQGVLDQSTLRVMRFRLLDVGPVAGSAGADLPEPAEARGLLFDSNELLEPALASSRASSFASRAESPDALFSTTLPLEIGGRRWEVQFSAPKTAEVTPLAAGMPWWGLAGGLLSSLLLAGMLYSLASSRSRAESIARVMTKDLRTSQELLQAIIDNSTAVIYVKDLKGHYLLVNHRFEELFHIARKDVVGKTDYDIFPEDRAAAFQAFDQRVLAAGHALEAEEVAPHDDGLHTYISIKAPLHDATGKPYALCGISADISDRKLAEEELKHHRDHLEDLVKNRTAELTVAKEKADVANQAKSTFLSSMSHELRTPLNAVLGYAQILKRDKGLTERQTTGINTIQQSGEHLLTLINDILDLAKIETGKFELYPAAINLPLFLRTVGDIIRVKAEEKSLLFNFDMQADLPLTVQADEKRLRQVLLNLLSNAVKFTDRGQISLRVQCAPCCGDEAHLHFEIEDSGIGISAEQQAMLFSPFTQVGDVQRRFGGTGLGLAISRQLVRLMGSDIEIDSQPGKGSRFSFEISVPAAAESAAIPVPPAITGYRGPRKKVLIVDDVVANRAMLVDLLGDLGFDATEAVNGQEGLEQAQRLGNKPDLIIMDMVMPVMDGPEAMRRIRDSAIPNLQALPIIAVSASASEEDQAQYLAAGANVFLSKPIDAQRLLQQIGDLLNLTWTVEKSAPEVAVIEGPLVAPPRAELEALHALALTGNMRDILRWLDHLKSLGNEYHPFADKLRRLAEGFQSKAILMLVKDYLQKTKAP